MRTRSTFIPVLVAAACVTITLAAAALLWLIGTPAGAELSWQRAVFAAANAASGSGLPTDFSYGKGGQLTVWALGIGGMCAVLWPVIGWRTSWLLPLAVVSPSGFATWGTASEFRGVAVAFVVATAVLWLAPTPRIERSNGSWRFDLPTRGVGATLLVVLLLSGALPVAVRVLVTGTTAPTDVGITWALSLLTLLHVGGVAILVRPGRWLTGVAVLFAGLSIWLMMKETNVPPMRLLTLAASAASTGGTDVGPINVSEDALLALAATQTLAKCWALWLVWSWPAAWRVRPQALLQVASQAQS